MFIISKSWMDRGTGFLRTGCLGMMLWMGTGMLILCGQRHVIESDRRSHGQGCQVPLHTYHWDMCICPGGKQGSEELCMPPG